MPSVPTPLEVVARHPLLRELTAPALRGLVADSTQVCLRPKRVVLREGDPPTCAYFLLSGAVRVFHRAGDAEYLLKLFRGPALFGEMEVMTRRPFLEHVVTLVPSELLTVPAETFRSLVDSQPRFASVLAYDLASRLCIAAHNLRGLAFGNLENRLAHLLLDYAALFGQDHAGEVRLELALSQEMMARDLAVSRKAINDALTELKRRRFLEKRQARYVLTAPAQLRALSTGTLSLGFQSDARRGPPLLPLSQSDRRAR